MNSNHLNIQDLRSSGEPNDSPAAIRAHFNSPLRDVTCIESIVSSFQDMHRSSDGLDIDELFAFKFDEYLQQFAEEVVSQESEESSHLQAGEKKVFSVDQPDGKIQKELQETYGLQLKDPSYLCPFCRGYAFELWRAKAYQGQQRGGDKVRYLTFETLQNSPFYEELVEECGEKSRNPSIFALAMWCILDIFDCGFIRENRISTLLDNFDIAREEHPCFVNGFHSLENRYTKILDDINHLDSNLIEPCTNGLSRKNSRGYLSQLLDPHKQIWKALPSGRLTPSPTQVATGPVALKMQPKFAPGQGSTLATLFLNTRKDVEIVGRRLQGQRKHSMMPTIFLENAPSVSLNHVGIRLTNKGVIITDLGSASSTWMRLGEESQMVVKSGDVLMIGDVMLSVLFAHVFPLRLWDPDYALDCWETDRDLVGRDRPTWESVVSEEKFGFNSDKLCRPEVTLRINSGAHVGSLLKNYQTVKTKKEKYCSEVSIGKMGCKFNLREDSIQPAHLLMKWVDGIGWTASECGPRSRVYVSLSEFNDLCFEVASRPIVFKQQKLAMKIGFVDVHIEADQ